MYASTGYRKARKIQNLPKAKKGQKIVESHVCQRLEGTLYIREDDDKE